MAPTHLAGGHLAYLLAAWWSGHEPALPEALAAAGAALAPDLDSRQSLVGRAVPWLSGALEQWAGHRTAAHSLLASLAVAGLGGLLLPHGYALAVAAGFASHPLLDMMTPSGVAWLWPARARCVLPGDARWRMEAMGRGELAFLVVVVACTAPALLAAEREAGLLGTVRDALGRIEQARRHYDAHKGEAVWWLQLQAQDNEAFRPVEGRFRVIGPYRANGLIVATAEGPHSVCRAEACDWYAQRAVLVRGEAQETTTRRLVAEAVSRVELLEALRPLQGAGRVYLRGQVTGEVAADEPAIGETADGAELRYARPKQLAARMRAAELEAVRLSVQVRHQPGQPVPQLHPPEAEEPQEPIPPRLERHLP
nr:metal-dependent hydrolase [Halorhodospira neutriphila]